MSLRLLMTADTAGGVWIHALSLCQALAPAGVRVRLVALGEPSPRQRAAATRLHNVTLVCRATRLEWMSQPWQDLDVLEAELLRQARRARCDLVHLNHLVHGHLPWDRPVLCAVHSCVTSWFEAVLGEPAPAEWDAYRSRVRRSLRAADVVVAPSRWMLERALALHGPFRAGTVVANGSAAPLAAPGSARAGVLAAGRTWDAAKNLAPLAELAPSLSAPLAIVGPLHAPDGQAAASAALGLGELAQDALWDRMRRAAVFVAPARYEPFGLGILEAARSGCALVLGDVPSLRENWEGAAVFVDPERPAQWQGAVERLLRRPDERLRLAEAARARGARYTLARMARGYLAVYRRLTGAPAGEMAS